MFFIKIIQEEGASVAGDSVAGMDSDVGGTSVEREPSLAGMTLDGELKSLADSEASGSAEDLAVLTKPYPAVSAKSVAGVSEVLAGDGSVILAESEAGTLVDSVRC